MKRKFFNVFINFYMSRGAESFDYARKCFRSGEYYAAAQHYENAAQYFRECVYDLARKSRKKGEAK